MTEVRNNLRSKSAKHSTLLLIYYEKGDSEIHLFINFTFTSKLLQQKNNYQIF